MASFKVDEGFDAAVGQADVHYGQDDRERFSPDVTGGYKLSCLRGKSERLGPCPVH